MLRAIKRFFLHWLLQSAIDEYYQWSGIDGGVCPMCRDYHGDASYQLCATCQFFCYVISGSVIGKRWPDHFN